MHVIIHNQSEAAGLSGKGLSALLTFPRNLQTFQLNRIQTQSAPFTCVFYHHAVPFRYEASMTTPLRVAWCEVVFNNIFSTVFASHLKTEQPNEMTSEAMRRAVK